MDTNQAIAALSTAIVDRDRAEQRITQTVIDARQAGASWEAIGAELGLTKQRAHQLYAGVSRSATAERYAAAEERGRQKAATILEEIRVNVWESPTAPESKIVDEDVAGDSVTPSIFLDPIAPATKKAAPKLPKFAKAYGDEYPKTRPVYTLPGTPPTTAQPGTGKGKHQCPSCGDTNHHGPKCGTVAMFADCTPTKYDPPATAEFMNARTK